MLKVDGHGGGHSSSHGSSAKSSGVKTVSSVKTGTYTSKLKTSNSGKTLTTYSKDNYKSAVPSYGTKDYHASDWISPNVWTVLYLCSAHHSNAVAAGTDENKEIIDSADSLEEKMNALGLSDAEKQTILAAIETGVLDDNDISIEKVAEKLDAQNQAVIDEENVSNIFGWICIIAIIILGIFLIIVIIKAIRN